MNLFCPIGPQEAACAVRRLDTEPPPLLPENLKRRAALDSGDDLRAARRAFANIRRLQSDPFIRSGISENFDARDLSPFECLDVKPLSGWRFGQLCFAFVVREIHFAGPRIGDHAALSVTMDEGDDKRFDQAIRPPLFAGIHSKATPVRNACCFSRKEKISSEGDRERGVRWPIDAAPLPKASR